MVQLLIIVHYAVLQRNSGWKQKCCLCMKLFQHLQCPLPAECTFIPKVCPCTQIEGKSFFFLQYLKHMQGIGNHCQPFKLFCKHFCKRYRSASGIHHQHISFPDQACSIPGKLFLLLRIFFCPFFQPVILLCHSYADCTAVYPMQTILPFQFQKISADRLN